MNFEPRRATTSRLPPRSGDDAPSSVREQECPRHTTRVVRTPEGKLMTVAGCGDTGQRGEGTDSVLSRNQDSGRYQRDDRKHSGCAM